MDFEAMVSPHLNDLYKYCLYITGSRWDGEDLYQETLLKLFASRHHISRAQSVKALLFKSAKHLWIDDYRKRRSRVLISDVLDMPPHVDVNYAEVRGRLEELAECLPERYMEMLLLAEVYHYSMQDIADRTCSTIPAVKCAIHRARTMLRKKEKKYKTAGRRNDVERWTQSIVYDRPIA